MHPYKGAVKIFRTPCIRPRLYFRKFLGHPYMGALRGHLCDSTAFLLLKVKVWVLAIALLTWVDSNSSALQSWKWQLIGMCTWYHGALCGHPLPAKADNWTRGAAHVSYYSFPVPLRVGSWVGLSTQQVNSLLKVACKGPGRDSHSQSQRERYECDTLPLDHLHLQRHMGVNNLPRVVTQQCASRELNLRPLDHKSNILTTTLPSHPWLVA